MQRATITGIRVRSPADARVIFHSVALNICPMVTRRLDTEERSLISSGSVYVWEERGPHAELTGVGIERWTDGMRWGPSRVREGFLFYHEKPLSQPLYPDSSSPAYDPMRSVMIKQTYTVYVDTPRGRKKWHLIAYFTEETVGRLSSIDDFPELASMVVPHAKYKSARSAKGRPDNLFSGPESQSPVFSRLQYVPYTPKLPSPFPVPPSTHQGPDHVYENTHRGRSVPHHSPALTNASSSSEEITRDVLVPLEYLQDNPRPRRDPTDEKILMLLTSRGFKDKNRVDACSPGLRYGRLSG